MSSIPGALVALVVLSAGLLFGARAEAQAPINSNVALQPPKGGVIVRQQFRVSTADFAKNGADLNITLATEATTFVYGVTDSFTLLLNAPVVLSRRIKNNTTGARNTNAGLADWTALAKVRLYRSDTSPSDTMRFDALAGLQFPTGADAFSSDSVDPIIGGVFTVARGRNFFDADFLWKFDTSGDQPGRMRADTALIRRVWPAAYTRPNPSALNALIELNGVYETNGDGELFLSPGIQYVMTRWIIEATVQIPVLQSLDHRPEADYIFGIGVRTQF